MVVFVCVYKSESLTTAFDKVRTSEESRKTTEKMKWSSTVSQTPAGVEKSVLKRIQVLVLVLLASHTLCDAHSVSASCCSREPPRACRLYVLLLCGPVGGAGRPLGGMHLGEDASAGILTLGKREAEEQHFHSRLHQLLRGGARNQAAGILTMGKRSEEEEAVGLLMQWAQQDFTA
ncbi:unnamed protein product [Gadus morhua 'NCC']